MKSKAKKPSMRAALARIAELEAQLAAVPAVAVVDKALTSHDVAKLLRANATSVNKWAEEGHLKCYRTPGGHRRFNARDVADFCGRFNMPIPAALVQHGA